MTPFATIRRKSSRRQRGQRGYAILLVLFMVTLMLLATIAIAPNVRTEGRREREAEMIWRGKQYARGVKLYYRKLGKFPTSLDQLTKPQIGDIHFMRQAYKDPMNAKDGEWRLIYVGPTGQLIGSLKPPETIQLSGIGGAGLPGTPASQLGSLPGQGAGQTAGGINQGFGQGTAQGFGQGTAQGFGQSFGQGLSQASNQLFGNTGAANSASGAAASLGQNGQPTANGQPSDPNAALNGSLAAGTASGATDAGASDAATEALLNSDPVEVIGGNIIGVGSKINQSSIQVYEKAKNYKQFEFIWNPAKDAITFGSAAPLQNGLPNTLQGQPGQPNQFGAPTSPISGPNGNGANGPGSIGAPSPGPPETTPQQNPPQQ